MFDFGVIYLFKIFDEITSVGGVMVSIDAFQALDPGSIPGHRIVLGNETRLNDRT